MPAAEINLLYIDYRASCKINKFDDLVNSNDFTNHLCIMLDLRGSRFYPYSQDL